MLSYDFRTEAVDQLAIGVVVACHTPRINAACMLGNPSSLIVLNASPIFMGGMENIGKRIKARLDEIGMTQAELARLTGMSAARLGNYVQGTRPPDILSLAKIARTLRTSTDWLLGLSETAPLETKPVFLRLLQLEGVPDTRAEVIAEAAARAIELLSSFPEGGDDQARAMLAAQAAWQTREIPKQH